MGERGSVTFWVLGLSLSVLMLGVLSVDLWSLMAHRRELASLADAAALAAASEIDEEAWRASRTLMLDRGSAELRAWAVIAGRPDVAEHLEGPWIEVDGVTVRIMLRRQVETALLGLAGLDRVTVGAASQATATLSP